MPSGTLHTSRRIQFWEQANQHALSLPILALDGKPGEAPGFDLRSEVPACARVLPGKYCGTLAAVLVSASP